MIYLLAQLAVAAVIQFADVKSTNMVLKEGGGEANPVVKWYMRKSGDDWHKAKYAHAAIAYGMMSLSYPMGFEQVVYVMLGVNLVTAAVVGNNMRIYYKLRKEK